jgi:cytochrome c oxidase assembly factor CtaG
MSVVVSILLAFGYLLGGRRPLRVLGAVPGWNARRWRALGFFVALILLALSTTGPIDQLARASLAARTARLIVLMMLVAPLLVLGAPESRIHRLIGPRRRAGGSSPFLPLASFAAFNAAVLLVFLPGVVHAMAVPAVAEVIDLGMVGLAYLFWSQVIGQPSRPCRLSYLGRVVYLFLSSMQLRLLGVLLGFASASFYSVPLSDQQIAAGILMVPGVVTDLVVLTVCLYLWLAEQDRGKAFAGVQRSRLHKSP